MTLGDAFNRRKKLGADLATWIGRLQAAGSTRRSFRTHAIDGGEAFVVFEAREIRSARRPPFRRVSKAP
mgnify:CR=1 FL=1